MPSTSSGGSVDYIRKGLRGGQYEITWEGQKKIREFAQNVVSTNRDEYASRGQSKRERIVQQIMHGKAAEVAVYRLWQQADLDRIIQPPDFEVYEENDKDFSADLRSVDASIHVKSCTMRSARKWGGSWVFQQKDPLVQQPTREDVVVLTYTFERNTIGAGNPLSAGAQVVDVISGREAQTLYAPMRKISLRKTKVCIYNEDL